MWFASGLELVGSFAPVGLGEGVIVDIDGEGECFSLECT